MMGGFKLYISAFEKTSLQVAYQGLGGGDNVETEA